ncbi:hypothetical protein ACHWQZ_G008117 [Mnemiopsis leidyi]
MSVRVRPIPIEEQLRTWNFPLYPINRRVNVRPKSNIHKIPAIEGRKLRVQSKEDETSCFFCTKPKSRPSSAASSVVLNPNVLIYPNQRFNENRPSSRKECRPRRLTIDGRQTPLAIECWQTNIKNHQMNQSQPHNTGNALVTRTVLEDKSQINRTASLPILLEKKSVEMKPRYEPKKPIRKRVQSRKEVKSEQPPQDKSFEPAEIPKQPENSKKLEGAEKTIDHSISVTITDKRTRSVVRASSATSLRLGKV